MILIQYMLRFAYFNIAMYSDYTNDPVIKRPFMMIKMNKVPIY